MKYRKEIFTILYLHLTCVFGGWKGKPPGWPIQEISEILEIKSASLASKPLRSLLNIEVPLKL